MPNPRTTQMFVNAGTELAKTFVEGYFNSRAMKVPTHEPIIRPQIIVTNPQKEEDGCDYCLLTRQLLAVHRYVLRAIEKPELSPIYTQLANDSLNDAIKTSWGIPSTTALSNIIKRLHDAELILSRPFTEDSYRKLAEAIWSYTDITLTFAEEDLSKED
jgi:hypothetical protein